MLQIVRKETKETFKTERDLSALEKLMRKLYYTPPHTVRTFIWKLTYRPEETIRKNTYFIRRLTPEEVMVLRAEVINHYKLIDHSLDYQRYNHKLEDETTPFAILRQKVNGDDVIMTEVMQKIGDFLKRFFYDYQEVIVTAVKDLKKANTNKTKIQALRDIGFSFSEANFLKEWTYQIGYVLEKEYKSFVPEIK